MEINRKQGFYCNRCCRCILVLCLVLMSTSSLAFSPSTNSVRNLHPQQEEDSNNCKVSIVTGANGFLGRHIVHQLLQQPKQQQVVCLVRSSRVSSETDYWHSLIIKNLHKYNNPVLVVMPYDMIDGGVTLENSIRTFDRRPFTVYHTASIFGPSKDPIRTAMHNVQGTEDVVRTIAKFNESCGSNQLVLTSSMAAVRGPGQLPTGGDRNCFTAQDWNTISTLDANSWGKCYQWSKMQSERSAWELSNKLKVTMTSLCPSLIVGPPTFSNFTKDTKLSYSLDLVEGWMKGDSPVQTRLFVDVRDVATAHVAAAAASRGGKRYIVSCERRISAQVIATSLRNILNEHKQQHNFYYCDPSKIYCDEKFDGGSIPIGEQEVLASDALKTDLGVVCRPVTETLLDMGRELLLLRGKGA